MTKYDDLVKQLGYLNKMSKDIYMIDSSGLNRYSIYSARWKKHDKPFTIKKGKQVMVIEGYYLPSQRISVSVKPVDLFDIIHALMNYAENEKRASGQSREAGGE
jgi:hypothetical protein